MNPFHPYSPTKRSRNYDYDYRRNYRNYRYLFYPYSKEYPRARMSKVSRAWKTSPVFGCLNGKYGPHGPSGKPAVGLRDIFFWCAYERERAQGRQ